MSREEAIAKLKEKRQIFIDEWADLDDIVEALDMAISALSAEQVTSKLKSVEISTDKDDESTMSQPNGKLDLISRAEAKAEIRKRFPNLIDRIEINTVLNELPSVSADRPSGEWIPKQMQHKATREVYEMAECSVCGASYVRYENDGYSFDLNKPNYCPNCGARMKGGAE